MEVNLTLRCANLDISQATSASAVSPQQPLTKVVPRWGQFDLEVGQQNLAREVSIKFQWVESVPKFCGIRIYPVITSDRELPIAVRL
jgi:hypothetical protein